MAAEGSGMSFGKLLQLVRAPPASDDVLQGFVDLAKTNFEVFKSELVQKALNYAFKDGHRGKKLFDGANVKWCLLGTSYLLAGSTFSNEVVVASGLLILDSLCEVEPLYYRYLKENFGREVAKLVKDVKKLSRLSEISGKEPLGNSELLPDLILAMGVNADALVIKMSERIMQMAAISLDPGKMQESVNEFLRAYIPLLERLGLGRMKNQLENLCPCADDNLKVLYARVSEKDENGEAFKDILEKKLRDERLPYVAVEFRKKSLLSIQNKISKKEIQNKISEDQEISSEIRDILGMRIIIEDKECKEARTNAEKKQAKDEVLKRCYQAKEVVAKLWEVKDVKDFIGTPKEDGYESLHVIVKNPNDHHMEVQIRTNEMHEKFDDGHWLYKEGNVREDVIGMVKMARLAIEQGGNIPVYVVVAVENEMTLEQHPKRTVLNALCKEKEWKGRVLVNKEEVDLNYILNTGDIIEFVRSSGE